MSVEKLQVITRGMSVTVFACFMGYLFYHLIVFLEGLSRHCP